METILFQGDSITDCFRSRDSLDNLGSGYPLLVKAELGYTYPGKYCFLNRGISGNRIVDLYARIKVDMINIKPDYLSILIGVNDVWHEFYEHNGVSSAKFEKIYAMLIDELREALPKTKIIIMSPFCLRASATDNTTDCPEKWSLFSQEVKNRAEAAKRIAEKYGLVFIPLQELFDQAAREIGNIYWLRDGVHPTEMGHELIKRAWVNAFLNLTSKNEE